MGLSLQTEMTIQGIFPAILTAFRPNGEPDLDLFSAHLERLYQAGVDGVYVGGNAGEWSVMTIAERKLLAARAVEISRHAHRKTLVHVGAFRTEDSIDLARHAEKIGADAISSLPPYVQPCTLDEVRFWFEQVALSSGLPFFIYYFPRLTGGALGQPFFEAMRAVPRVSGYKFTDVNLFDLSILLESGLTVLNGHDPNLHASLLMGAAGGIGSFYNVAPRTATALHRQVRAGDTRCAAEHQAVLNRLIRIVRGYRLIPALKFISHLQGFSQGSLRPPLLPLSADEERTLASKVENLLCRL
jgi:N-acetylneuraminate lyase